VKLNCKTCGKPILADDINIKLAIAKGGACHAVFGFADQLGSHSAPASRRAEVPLPGGMKIDRWGPELTITRRWFSAVLLFLVFFCIAWDSFLVFWYTMAFRADAPWIMKVFPIVHVAVGVGLTYYTIAGFVNSTVCGSARAS